MNETWKIALLRALFITALPAAGLAFVVVGQAEGIEAGLWAAGVAFFTAIASRGGVEGMIDSGNATQRAADSAKYRRTPIQPPNPPNQNGGV